MTAPLSDFFDAYQKFPIKREVQGWLGTTLQASLTFTSDIRIVIETPDVTIGADAQGRPVANRVEPRKRPRSAMSPMIVLRDDKPYLLLGSPGGSSIILYVAKTLIGALDWQLDIQQAIALPNMGSRNRDTELEKGSSLESLQQALRQNGHRVTIAPSPSGVHAIMIKPDGLFGGADPRREGVALGD
jgi:gamma-glutamyltranspeptidase/glutathione hydrolase